jgi:KaiC/GvpD/RAD55 family RecA-like ATPase
VVEEQIIKLFCTDKEYYSKYYKYVNLNYIKSNYTSHYKLFNSIDSYYNAYPDKESISTTELEIQYNSNYLLQESERKELTLLVTRIFEAEITNKDAVINLLNEHRRRGLAGDLAKLALDVEDGSADPQSLIEKFKDFEVDEVTDKKFDFQNMSLKHIYDEQDNYPGLRWRLNWLNKSLGSLRKGNFGFLFARPETGKTTFLASEITHMIKQTDGDIIWFNNEESNRVVADRINQAFAGVERRILKGQQQAAYEKQYEDIVGDRIKLVGNEITESTDPKKIEEILKATNPALIIFDQIDKIKGFKADRNDLELKAIYQWAREIAKKYAPVIAVSQASGEADGKLWLTMNMVDGSKTSKQGEADWMLGIGKEQDNTSRLRYFNILKNKLPGDDDTLPDLRHGSTQVLIKPEIARYEDI